MVVIRLSRVGKKNSPAYRVVVAEKRRAVKRKFIEVIGHYNPILKPKELKIDAERASFWMEQGAQPSDTVRNLMADLGILKKEERVNIKYAKAKKKKELKAEKEGEDKPEAKTEAPTKEAEVPVEEKEEDKTEVKAAPVEEKKAEEKKKEKKTDKPEPKAEKSEEKKKEDDKPTKDKKKDK